MERVVSGPARRTDGRTTGVKKKKEKKKGRRAPDVPWCSILQDCLPQFCRSFVVPDLLPELPALLPAQFASFEEPVQLSVWKASVEAGLVECLFQLEQAIERSVSRLCSVVRSGDHDVLEGERLMSVSKSESRQVDLRPVTRPLGPSLSKMKTLRAQRVLIEPALSDTQPAPLSPSAPHLAIGQPFRVAGKRRAHADAATPSECARLVTRSTRDGKQGMQPRCSWPSEPWRDFAERAL